MDINSLLSPQDSPSSEQPPNASSPQPSPARRPGRPAKRKSSGLSKQVTADSPPQQHSLLHPATAARNAATYMPPTGLLSPSSAGASQDARPTLSPMSTPNAQAMHRHGSSPGMDTLADLASMQHHQQAARHSANSMRPSQVYQHAPSVSYNLHNIHRAAPQHPSPRDRPMPDAPEVQRDYTAAALSAEASQEIAGIVAHLKETPYDLPSHMRLVNILHQGFVDHVNPPNDPTVMNDPYSYELLSELLRARHSMESKFPVGEELWVKWLKDEIMLARNSDDRIGVMELCQKAVDDEPSSAVLWRLYADYMLELYQNAHGLQQSDWSEDDKAIAKEVFQWQQILDILESGKARTQWHMNDSSLVWNRWAEVMLEDLNQRPSPQKTQAVREAFDARLSQPHATWSETFSLFSSFISKYYSSEWEQIMDKKNASSQKAKDQYSLREQFEFNLETAAQKGDKEAEREAFSEYLLWEVRLQGPFSFNLVNALYERATLRFPIDQLFWEEWVEFLIEKPSEGRVLPVLESANRHCPWSGNLWSHRVLALEAEGRSFDEIEAVKHSATETGLLDVGGMEELLKVYIAWCGYLRRKAFGPNSTEDDVDIAEVGIQSAEEHVREIGEQRFGRGYTGDPLYRLERIHIKFFTTKGDVPAARECWKGLVPRQENSYDFWYRYYIFEMVAWANHCMKKEGDTDNRRLQAPRAATEILRQGISRVETLDWPEALITMFQNHCEQHETVQEYRLAIIEARKATSLCTKRRAREAAAYQQQTAAVAEVADVTMQDAVAGGITTNGKRKRAESEATDATDVKKIDSQHRDREHNTVFVTNVPPEANETRVRKFFSDCGQVVSVKCVQNEDGRGQTATVEFADAEDAQYAVSRDSKVLDGNIIRVSQGTGCVLFLANYPEEWQGSSTPFLHLFKEHGKVVEVRFPSLAKNTRRRFCYVTMATPQEADAAAAKLNQIALTGARGTLRMSVLKSDPDRKKKRDGAIEDGRQIIIGNLAYEATDEEVRDLVSPLDGFQNFRRPHGVGGSRKAVAFADFDTAAQAAVAQEKLNSHVVHGRALRVSIAEHKGYKPKVTQLADDVDKSKGSEVGDGESYKARSFGLMDVPDTVNNARIIEVVKEIGPYVKVTRVAENNGAIIEMKNLSDVGKAQMRLDGYEMVPGHKVRVGTVGALRRVARKEQSDSDAKPRNHPPAFMPPPPPPRPNRPGQPKTRGRGGFGLGFKRTVPNSDKSADKTDTAGVKKDNNYFKTMFVKAGSSNDGGKKEASAPDGGGEKASEHKT
ncbi:hypothetical protein K490DRAFT_32621 [Saccharata proteae CBS 121410]|uniref:RRM domain-containing protein n=1 Tax=Saccharata proteae CBS 121410 TaxID=1314787 RepID=A0A9P4I5G7_9PEZI|nr:hypothetical protein K490DRAFT_32621 [Saccharata proteae CBS 121410]